MFLAVCLCAIPLLSLRFRSCHVQPPPPQNPPLTDAEAAVAYPLNGFDLLAADQPTREALRRCTRDPGWYKPSLFCNRAADNGGVDFGCPYLFPANSLCANNGGNRRGCALEFQQGYQGRVRLAGLPCLSC